MESSFKSDFETGELQTLTNIYKAAEIAIEGSDFIKPQQEK